jgi:adenylate kinase family enzyme
VLWQALDKREKKVGENVVLLMEEGKLIPLELITACLKAYPRVAQDTALPWHARGRQEYFEKLQEEKGSMQLLLNAYPMSVEEATALDSMLAEYGMEACI